MTARCGMAKLRVVLCLAAIVTASAALSIRWVFLVPIFQAPDEPQHFDYALCLSEHRALYHGQPMHFEGDHSFVHPWTNYLRKAARIDTVAFHPDVRMPPNYGTRAFYDTLERQAPPVDGDTLNRPPLLAGVYPFGYYGLLAVWLEGVRFVHDGPAALLFGARLFSVLLLCITLIFTYATARELNLKQRTALLLTAAIGLFPLTSFVSSYVQPDNLAWTLSSLCFYLSLRLRQQPDNGSLLAWLGLASGALLVTKPHYYLCVFGCGAAALLVQRLYLRLSLASWLRFGALVLGPAFALGLVHLKMTCDAPNYYSDPAPSSSFSAKVLHGFPRAALNYYAGPTHDSFWGVFGWMDTHLVIGNYKWTARVQSVLQIAAWLVLALTLMRLSQVLWRLHGLWRRGRRRLALRIALANVPINSYFAFTILMFVLFIRLDNRFAAQGRNWLPFLLPIFLTAFAYAPCALAWRRIGFACGTLGLLGLLLYDGVGGYYALRTIRDRYYVPAASVSAAPGDSGSPDRDRASQRSRHN